MSCEGSHDLAVAKLTRAIVLQPQNPVLFSRRAAAYASLGNHHAAILNLRKALSLNPSDSPTLTAQLAIAYYQHGQVLEADGWHDRASVMYQRASECDPGAKEYVMRRWGMQNTLSLHVVGHSQA